MMTWLILLKRWYPQWIQCCFPKPSQTTLISLKLSLFLFILRNLRETSYLVGFLWAGSNIECCQLGAMIYYIWYSSYTYKFCSISYRMLSTRGLIASFRVHAESHKQSSRSYVGAFSLQRPLFRWNKFVMQLGKPSAADTPVQPCHVPSIDL